MGNSKQNRNKLHKAFTINNINPIETIIKIIPPILIPKNLIDSYLTFRSKNIDSEFEKTIRRLSYYTTKHGAKSTCMRLFFSPRIFMLNHKRRALFIRKCHEGFNLVQNEIVSMLPEIEAELPQLRKSYREEVRKYKKDRKPPIPRYSKAGIAYSEQSFQSMLLKEIANSIAWQILGNDGTKVRALIQGVSSGPLQSAQLQSMLPIVNKFNSLDKSRFALITDITSCIQSGDLLMRLPTGEFGLCELKDGIVNEHIESLLNMPPVDQSSVEKFDELLSKYGTPFIKQFKRVLKQKQRMQMALDYINESVGIDIQYNKPKITNVTPKITDTYHTEINRLLRAIKRKGEGYQIIDDCLVLGAFNNVVLNRSTDVCKKDFQHAVWHMFFEKWSECPYGKEVDKEKVVKHFEYMLLPVWEMRNKVLIPTHRPIFISGIKDEYVFDILFERISLFFYFSPQRFVTLCKKKRIDATWITGREYRRIKAQALESKIILLDIHDGVVEIKDDTQGIVQHIALGTLWKIIYEFERPAALAEFYKEDLTTLPERLKQAQEKGYGVQKDGK